MLGLKKIALTGGLAVGKSTVCRLLQDHGAYVVDADAIVHQLLTLTSPVGQEIVKLLGPDIVVNHQINRKKISNIVFSNPVKLKALESILHPAVRAEINQLFETVKDNAAYRFFVAEVPLLYEAQMEDDFDIVIAVVSDPKIARLRAPDKEEFDRRSRFQLPQAVKRAEADYVIVNQGDLTVLKTEVDRLIPQLLV